MGDMADMALDYAESTVRHYEKHRFSSPITRYEEGLVDELGNEYPGPGSKLWPVASRSAPIYKLKCPLCGGRLNLKTGIHGKFWGCSYFPKCKGSRSY